MIMNKLLLLRDILAKNVRLEFRTRNSEENKSQKVFFKTTIHTFYLFVALDRVIRFRTLS